MKRKAVDQQTIRCINQKLIIETVRKSKRITRAGISECLQLSAPSVSANIEKLLQKGLLLEYKIDAGANDGPGRKGTSIALNQSFAYILCVDLSGPALQIGLGDACEEILSYKQYDVLEGAVAIDICHCMLRAIDDTLRTNQVSADRIGAIVICSPGVIDTNTGKIGYAPQFPGWENFDISSILTQKYNAQVLLKNDINVIALGELMHGIGQQCDSFVYINIDLGVGGGIVLNGELLEGAQFAGGEIGYMLTCVEQLSHKPQQGHLESLISIPAIRANIARRMGCAEKNMTIQKISTLYKEGNYVVLQEMDYICKLLAMCIVNITAVLNIPVVCLGGMIGDFHVDFDKKIYQAIEQMVPYPPRVCFSKMGKIGFMRGALYLGARKIFLDAINK